jgi:hypothetical protein
VAAKKTTGSMFGAVEDRPKKVMPAGIGREADPKKLAHLTTLFEQFATYAAANPILKGQQVPVVDLGEWSPASLAITGNKLLDNMRSNGSNPGFYLLATDLVHDGETSKGKPRMVASKLVIRAGDRPTRNRNSKDGS